ncbi:MAG: hypothetical protein Ta2E_12560 [Mycoplasmoidaceae bacterium]|nr:MAG: hypothetical protein Ta2E_12560 [Mycoplasmoidaceae bacterium]
MIWWKKQENFDQYDGKIIKCRRGQTAKRITGMLNSRHFDALDNQKVRGQSMVTFKGSIVSNFYVGNYKG